MTAPGRIPTAGPATPRAGHWQTTGFEVVQVRMQAQLSRHPRPADWQHWEAIRDPRALIEALRRTPLAPWVANLSAAGDIHDIDHSIRGTFTGEVERVADWAPPPWRAAIRWLVHLPYLPALHYLLDGRPAPAWMGEGHRLRPFASPDPAARREALIREGHGWAVAARDADRNLLSAWLERWRDLRPPCRGQTRDALARLEVLLETLSSPGPEPAGPAAEHPEPAGELHRLFRRLAFRPPAIFAYLGLLALDLERLRGLLAVRALFPPPPPPDGKRPQAAEGGAT